MNRLNNLLTSSLSEHFIKSTNHNEQGLSEGNMDDLTFENECTGRIYQ